jgi:hypothetical protein
MFYVLTRGNIARAFNTARYESGNGDVKRGAWCETVRSCEGAPQLEQYGMAGLDRAYLLSVRGE